MSPSSSCSTPLLYPSLLVLYPPLLVPPTPATHTQSLEDLEGHIRTHRSKIQVRKDALADYMITLQQGVAETQNRKAVSLPAKKNQARLGKLSDANQVLKAHKGKGGSKIKQALAMNNQLLGAFGEFTFLKLKAAKVIVGFRYKYIYNI